MTREIPIKGGAVALVDDEDFERLSLLMWSFAGSSIKYAYSSAGYMHRLVIGAPDGQHVDHINSEPLDNRRSNLRLCSQSSNLANRRPGKGKRLKGVTGKRGQWRARVSLRSGEIFVGSFGSAEAAARAYDVKLRELFGPFARCNFPEESSKVAPATYREQLRAERCCPICSSAVPIANVGQPRKYCSTICKEKARVR